MLTVFQNVFIDAQKKLKISTKFFFQLVFLTILIISFSFPLNLLQKLTAMKDKLVEKVLGDDNCGCPCREYHVTKCDVEWVEHCYQDGYDTRCEKRQVFRPRKVS